MVIVEVQGSGLGAQSSELRAQSAELRAQSAERGVCLPEKKHSLE
jgi:hypothetical protein